MSFFRVDIDGYNLRMDIAGSRVSFKTWMRPELDY